MSTTVISVRGKDRVLLQANTSFVYVGRAVARSGWRASVFANPYTVKNWGERAVELFELDLLAAIRGRRVPERTLPDGWGTVQFDALFQLMAPRIKELRNMTLGCWCGHWRPGEPEIGCHAVVLAKAADGELGGLH